MSRLMVNAPAVVSEIIDGEAVIMNLDSGHYFSARGTGAAVWSLLDAGWPPESIARAVASRYKLSLGDAELALRDFMADLDRHALVRETATIIGAVSAESASSDMADFPSEWGPPSLEVFTDMEDLLLLDPIHEVSDEGWPMPQPGISNA